MSEKLIIEESDAVKLDRALWKALESSTTLIATGRLVDSDANAMIIDDAIQEKLKAIGFNEHEINLILIECETNNITLMGLFRQSLRLYQESNEQIINIPINNKDKSWTIK